MSGKETVGVGEAADLMEVHPETIKEMCIAGALPAAKIGRAWVMLRSDVMQHVTNQIRAQTASRIGKRPGRRPSARAA